MRLIPVADPATASAVAGSADASPSSAPASAVTAVAPNPTVPWQIRTNELALQNWTIGLIDHVPAPPVAVEVSIEATLNGLSNQPQTPVTVAALVDLSSGGSLRAGGVLNILPQFDFTGELALAGLALPVIQPYVAPFANISVDSGLLGVTGELTAAPAGVRFAGSVALDDFAVTDTVQRESLLGLGGVAISSLVVNM